MAINEITSDPQPVRRFGWVRWLLPLYALMIAALFGMRFVWMHAAQQRLDVEIARVTDQGLTLNWLDLQPPSVPEAENAVVLYDRADLLLAAAAHRSLYLSDLLASRTFRAEQAEEVDAILQQNREVFELLRQARHRPGVDWGVRHERPASRQMMPALGQQRSFARLSLLRALTQAERSQWAGAAEDIRDALAAGGAAGQSLTIFGGIDDVALVQLSSDAAGELAAYLNDQPPGSLTDADRQAIGGLIDDLLAAPPAGQLARAFHAERVIADDTVRWFYWDAPPGSSYAEDRPWLLKWPVGWFFKPLATEDRRFGLWYMNETYEASGAPNYSEMMLQAPDDVHMYLPSHVGILGFSALHVPSLRWSVDLWYRGRLNSRLVATSLAIALYRQDNGEFPPDLASLVPDYLEAVPVDPYDPAGGPLRAVLAGNQPRVYSVYENGVDDGGDWKPWGYDGPRGFIYWEDAPDLPMFLRLEDIYDEPVGPEVTSPSRRGGYRLPPGMTPPPGVTPPGMPPGMTPPPGMAPPATGPAPASQPAAMDMTRP